MATNLGPRVIPLKPTTPKNRSISTTKLAKSPFSKAAKPIRQRIVSSTSRPAIRARIPLFNHHLAPSTTLTRHASSSASTTPNQPATSEDVLTWNRFFDLRRKRRYLNLGSSVITASAAIGIFGPVIAQQDIDANIRHRSYLCTGHYYIRSRSWWMAMWAKLRQCYVQGLGWEERLESGNCGGER